MHTRDYEYTDEDLKYGNIDKPLVYIHYNSDLSGEIIITKTAGGPLPRDYEEVKIPGWMLLDFVGEHYGREWISMLEDKTGREILKLLSGV